MVIERLVAERLASVTLDFDGSVLSTGRHAEGTAVGFNNESSYYPLFCTVAQTDQVLDVHHRPGNVHDSAPTPSSSSVEVAEAFKECLVGIGNHDEVEVAPLVCFATSDRAKHQRSRDQQASVHEATRAEARRRAPSPTRGRRGLEDRLHP